MNVGYPHVGYPHVGYPHVGTLLDAHRLSSFQDFILHTFVHTYLPFIAECLDILKRMLLPDPAERITIEKILTHPWFVARLPSEVSLGGDVISVTVTPPTPSSCPPMISVKDQCGSV